MGSQQMEQRLARLRDAMSQQDLDAFYVRDTSNIRWLTAFDEVFDAERAHALMVTADEAILHTDSRYSAACERNARDTKLRVDSQRLSHEKVAAQLLAEGAHGNQEPAKPLLVGIEDDIALAEYRRLCAEFEEMVPAASFKETNGVVVGLRSVKDRDEIARMCAAQAITDKAFSHIIDYMKPGMTEREVQIELEDFMVRHGAQGLAFTSIVATGANGASPHAIPGDTVLESGQCVVLDFGARFEGYCSDMTRTVFLGKPEVQMLKAWETMRCANESVEAMLRPGVTGAEAHQLAEEILEQGGFGGKMGHGLGHGVGIDIHEEPNLSPRNQEPLAVGNVVTVEPGIYLPGQFGMRLEDFGVITERGFAAFTQSTHEMVVL